MPFTAVSACRPPCLRFAMAVSGHHARLGTRLRARLCRGLHFRRLSFISFQGTTRTKPDVRLSRIRLPPRVCDEPAAKCTASSYVYPAQVTRKPDTEFGACFARPHSPWSPPLAPSTPPPVAQLRSWTSQLLPRGLTSRVRSSSASAHHLPHADRRDVSCPAKREISQVPTSSFCA